MVTFTMALMSLTDNSFDIIEYPSNQKEFDIYIKNNGESPLPSYNDVMAKLAELQAAEPMRQLRIQRDQLLSATDWWCVSDRTPTQAQLDYRQALRDLPTTATPALDENGNLTGVEWPVKPA